MKIPANKKFGFPGMGWRTGILTDTGGCLPCAGQFQDLFMTKMNPQYLKTYFRIPQKPRTFPEEFVIVTAYNPEGKNYPVELNEQFDANLAAYLKERNLSSFRIMGGSKDFSHVEPGYVVETDFKAGLAIGTRFGQEAIFWIQQGKLLLVECATGAQTPMGEFEARIIG
jgi:Protein of unknown function (DUF3293)